MRDFVKKEASDILEEAIEAFQEESGEILFAGDERRMMINSFMYIAEIILNEINYRANNNLIALCDEETLIEKGNERNTYRIPAEKASVPVKFSIQTACAEAIKIAKGTRVTPDGVLFFETTEETSIPAGDFDVTVTCDAVEAGEEYNEIPVGEIKILVDTIPYITAVANTEESTGGSDEEKLEAYRKRVLEAPKAYSTAGSEPAYIAKVKEVDTRIADVQLVNDNTNVNIYVLCQDGEIPDEELLNKISDHVTDDAVKVFTDNVFVFPAVIKNYGIDVSYKISAADEELSETIKTNVELAVENYVSNLKSGMGKAINPEELRRYMYNAGATSVTVASPGAYTKLSKMEVAICDSKTVTYAGTLE